MKTKTLINSCEVTAELIGTYVYACADGSCSDAAANVWEVNHKVLISSLVTL